MALPSSGAISLNDVNIELGIASGTTISLNQSNVRTLFGRSSGGIGMSDGRGKSNVLALTISGTVSNYNIFTAAGSPTVATNVLLTITSSGVVGGVGATALTVGQFPSGSNITINNSGSIIGFGGGAGTSTTGGNGGDAIKSDYPNQTVVINNLSGGMIYGGGGGGGKGGTGGGGTYVSGANNLGNGYGGGSSCDHSCEVFHGGGVVCGNCVPNSDYLYCLECYIYTYSNSNGGGGGNGGVGQGYAQSNTNGSGGAAGGPNSGTGGTGGNGGAYGNNGATGATGANGNRTGGSGGSAGGTAGRYLVKGANTVTLNNSGTVAGGLA